MMTIIDNFVSHGVILLSLNSWAVTLGIKLCILGLLRYGNLLASLICWTWGKDVFWPSSPILMIWSR
ncbi:hypothetical protein Tsubulata_013360 [Turnera subulata]|uniref:Uncharacterized protein n=1 Tax=Turnera subulata TaxID=218843 RepID=A0A9Q0JHJ2_9ROSI|nr:hypothetical protein Tsubulata_013360 [Turnera subulata]